MEEREKEGPIESGCIIIARFQHMPSFIGHHGPSPVSILEPIVEQAQKKTTAAKSSTMISPSLQALWTVVGSETTVHQTCPTFIVPDSGLRIHQESEGLGNVLARCTSGVVPAFTSWDQGGG